MNNSTKLLNIALIILLSSNIFLLCMLFRHNRLEPLDLFDSTDYESTNYVTSYLDILENDGLSMDIKMIDVFNDSVITTRDLFMRNDSILYLVCRINELDCAECTNYAISKFLELDSIGQKVFTPIIIGTFDNYTAFSQFVPQKNLGCYYSESLHLPVEGRHKPYYFVMDSSMKVYDIFVPNRNFIQLTKTYFDLVTEKWTKIQ